MVRHATLLPQGPASKSAILQLQQEGVPHSAHQTCTCTHYTAQGGLFLLQLTIRPQYVHMYVCASTLSIPCHSVIYPTAAAVNSYGNPCESND